MTELDASTFDIGDLFSGKAFPKDEVVVYLDEASGYEINKARGVLADANIKGDLKEITEAEESLNALRKKVAGSKIVVHLTGVSRDTRRALWTKNATEFPRKKNFLGQDEPNLEGDEAFVNDQWALHIEKIVRPDGSFLNPTPADIAIFRGNAPDPANEAIAEAIRELSEGVKAGFEDVATGQDFLSQP